MMSDLLSRGESISRMAEHCHMTGVEITDYLARDAGQYIEYPEERSKFAESVSYESDRFHRH